MSEKILWDYKYWRKGVMILEERCLECKWCEIIEYGAKGFLGETVLKCFICEEETENKDICFQKKLP